MVRKFGGSGTNNTMHNLPDDADGPSVRINLDDKDPKPIEIVDDDADTGDDAGGQDQLPATDESLAGQEDDLRGRLGARTQKRINRLVLETNTERRARESAERERDTAIEFSRKQEAELAELRRRVDGGTQALSASMQAEKDAKIADAQRRLTQAHTDGDSAAIVQATTDLGQAQAEKLAVISRTPRAMTDAERADADKARAAAIPQAQPRRAELKPNVAAWIASQDSWFGKDKEKTDMAYAIHARVLARGIKDDSPEYTRELDKGLKAVYPDHQSYSDETAPRRSSTPRRTDVTAEGSRANERQQPSNPRIVELSPLQVHLANQLGLGKNLPAYAASIAKRNAAEKATQDD